MTISYTIEAQFYSNWQDITDQTISITSRHGGSTANPDQPDYQPLSGQLILHGITEVFAGRYPFRVRSGQTILLEGLLQEPRILPDQTTVWRTISRQQPIRAQTISLVQPAGTAAGILANAAITDRTGAIAVSNLPERSTTSFEFAGPLARFIGLAAQAAGAELLERKDGSLIAVNAAPTTPTGRNIIAPIQVITALQSRHLATRIRNTATVTIPARITGTNTAWEEDYTIPAQPGSSLTATLELPDDGATYSEFTATVEAEIEVETTRRDGGAQVFPDGTIWRWQRGQEYGWITAAATVTVAQNNTGQLIATVTVTVPATHQITYIIGAWDVDRDDPRSVGLPYVDGTPTPRGPVGTNTITIPTALRGSRATVTVTGTRTVSSTVPARKYKATIGSSVGVWGERELRLPAWIITNPVSGAAIVQQQIAGLAELRREHLVTLRAADPLVAELDCGQYVQIIVTDLLAGIGIRHWCLIVGRQISFYHQKLSTVTYRCLETGVAAMLPDDYITLDNVHLTLDGLALTLED